MLESLCGNKNVAKILIFLFVNGKCYGTQLHRCLKVPLTPLQKALLRLEKGGIILSFTEGKTRVYQFNPSFSLLSELEPLLKKAYTLLPASEKKNYYAIKEEHQSVAVQENKIKLLYAFWEKLCSIKQLSFLAKSKLGEESSWNGRGKGEVLVTKEGSNSLIFNEKGEWLGKQGTEVNFTNVFRWIFDKDAGLISLEHLRRGPNHPVFLFHLAPSGKSSLASVNSHLCEEDAYFGQMHLDPNGLRLHWRIIGPKKDEDIVYHYKVHL